MSLTVKMVRALAVDEALSRLSDTVWLAEELSYHAERAIASVVRIIRVVMDEVEPTYGTKAAREILGLMGLDYEEARELAELVEKYGSYREEERERILRATARVTLKTLLSGGEKW